MSTGLHKAWRRIHYQLQKGKCFYCKRRLRLSSHSNCAPDAITLDHIVPLAQGGPDTFINTVAACRACNNQKGRRGP